MKANQHQWFLKTLERENSLYCRIDLWGFLSVMVVLFFVVMVAQTTYHDMPTNAVDLTESHHATSMPGASREDAMRINIQSDGSIYFGYIRISRDDLPDLIREGIRNGAEKKVYVSADARAKYGRVIQVLHEVRLAGVEKVCFLTWQRQ
jgi:biopolymer transport protein ExbD/biopolymer transport protein TolR